MGGDLIIHLGKQKTKIAIEYKSSYGIDCGKFNPCNICCNCNRNCNSNNSRRLRLKCLKCGVDVIDSQRGVGLPKAFVACKKPQLQRGQHTQES